MGYNGSRFGVPNEGERVEVWWGDDTGFYGGTMVALKKAPKRAKKISDGLCAIRYDSGVVSSLNMLTEHWRYAPAAPRELKLRMARIVATAEAVADAADPAAPGAPPPPGGAGRGAGAEERAGAGAVVPEELAAAVDASIQRALAVHMAEITDRLSEVVDARVKAALAEVGEHIAHFVSEGSQNLPPAQKGAGAVDPQRHHVQNRWVQKTPPAAKVAAERGDAMPQQSAKRDAAQISKSAGNGTRMRAGEQAENTATPPRKYARTKMNGKRGIERKLANSERVLEPAVNVRPSMLGHATDAASKRDDDP